MTNELKDDEAVKAGVARLIAVKQKRDAARKVQEQKEEEEWQAALIRGKEEGRKAGIKWATEVASIDDIERLTKLPLRHKARHPKSGDYAGLHTDLTDYSKPTAEPDIKSLFVGDENSKPSVDAFCDAFYDAVTEIYKLIPEND
jgi:hypothetical protein